MWIILIVLRITIAHIVFPVVVKNTLKRLGDLPQSRKPILIGGQFLGSLLLSILMSLFFSFYEAPYKWNYLPFLAIGLGVLNSYGEYCAWRAMDISLSKTAIGTQMDDLIAISVEYLFFGAAVVYRPSLLVGIALCFTAVFFLTGLGATKKDLLNRRLIKFVIGYSVFWGLADASFRFFNLKGLPMSEFLICWYAGSCLGIAALMFFFNYIKREKISLKTSKRDKRDAIILSLSGAWIPMAIGYMIAKLVPVAVYQPVFLVSEAVLPTLIGLLYFKEHKEMKPKEWIAIALGFIGTILVGARW